MKRNTSLTLTAFGDTYAIQKSRIHTRSPGETTINLPNFYTEQMELILSDSSGWKHKNEQEEEIRSEFTEKGLMVLSFILLDEQQNSRFTCSRFIFSIPKHEICQVRLKIQFLPQRMIVNKSVKVLYIARL
jgi:hypothetical protein